MNTNEKNIFFGFYLLIRIDNFRVTLMNYEKLLVRNRTTVLLVIITVMQTLIASLNQLFMENQLLASAVNVR